MILSRVADALYWMGRYLERAENVTRLLLVTEELASEALGLDEAVARGEWEQLQAIFPGPEVRGRPGSAPRAFAAPLLLALSIEPRHPYSVFFSLKKARDNARTVREALTIEVFVNLNDTYRELEGYTRRQMADPPTFRSALTSVHRGILSTVGAVEQTLTRDAGWLFLKLGESLERVFRTSVVLQAKLPTLLSRDPKVDLALFYTQWRSLLRGLSSLENYRKAAGARIEPLEVVHFLLFDPHAPRSVRHGAAAVKDHLDRIASGPDLSQPARVMGKLVADLSYEGPDLVRRGDCLPFLERVAGDLARVHDALATLYFGT
jgi:uncharacterized alpha-E superfamily protein